MKKIFLICAAMIASISSFAQVPDSVEVCDTVVVVPTYEEVIYGYMDPIDLATVEPSTLYVGPTFVADFPSEVETKTKEGAELITCEEPGYDIRIMAFPIGLEPTGCDLIAKEFLSEMNLSTGRTTDLNGYTVRAYDATMQMSSEVAYVGKVYAYYTGINTILISAVSLNPEVDWWRDHIIFTTPETAELTPQKQLSAFTYFFNEIIGGDDDNNFKIDAEDNGTELIVDITNDRMTYHKNYRRMSKMLCSLINTFSVFRNYADAGYQFTLKYHDSKGEAQSGYEFPHSEYSKWLSNPSLVPDDCEPENEIYPVEEIGG